MSRVDVEKEIKTSGVVGFFSSSSCLGNISHSSGWHDNGGVCLHYNDSAALLRITSYQEFRVGK